MKKTSIVLIVLIVLATLLFALLFYLSMTKDNMASSIPVSLDFDGKAYSSLSYEYTQEEKETFLKQFTKGAIINPNLYSYYKDKLSVYSIGNKNTQAFVLVDSEKGTYLYQLVGTKPMEIEDKLKLYDPSAAINKVLINQKQIQETQIQDFIKLFKTASIVKTNTTNNSNTNTNSTNITSISSLVTVASTGPISNSVYIPEDMAHIVPIQIFFSNNTHITFDYNVYKKVITWSNDYTLSSELIQLIEQYI